MNRILLDTIIGMSFQIYMALINLHLFIHTLCQRQNFFFKFPRMAQSPQSIQFPAEFPMLYIIISGYEDIAVYFWRVGRPNIYFTCSQVPEPAGEALLQAEVLVHIYFFQLLQIRPGPVLILNQRVTRTMREKFFNAFSRLSLAQAYCYMCSHDINRNRCEFS